VADLLGQRLVECVREEEARQGQEGGSAGPRRPGEARLHRRRPFGKAAGRALEPGYGPPRSLPFYPSHVELTGVDSHHECSGVPGAAPSNSLARAPGSCRLEKLPYPDATFDAVTAACVFCSVSDRVEGLREAAGVTRPRSLILLHEHVRPTNPLLECLADPASRSRRAFGPEMNRRTVGNVQTAERYGTSRQQGRPFKDPP
jgi:SAM-dependent methyltransferase